MPKFVSPSTLLLLLACQTHFSFGEETQDRGHFLSQERDLQLQDLATQCPLNGEIGFFERVMLLDVIGRPGRVEPDEINLVEQAFMSVYNQAADCEGQPNYFQQANNVEILFDAVDAIGDGNRRLSLGAGTLTRPFTWPMVVRGLSCRGCDNDEFPLMYTDTRRRELASADNDNIEEEEEMSNVRKKGDPRHLRYGYGGYGGSRGRKSRNRRGKGKGGSSSSSSKSRRRPSKKIGGGGTPPPPMGCQCPAPRQDVLVSLLNQAFTVREIDQVVGFTEMAPVSNCPPRNGFSSTLRLNVVGDPFLVSQTELDIFEKAVLETYNELNALGSSTCDPYQRLAATEGAQAQLVANPSTSNFQIDIFLIGTCRGCPDGAPLFADGNSRQLTGEEEQELDEGVVEDAVVEEPDMGPKLEPEEEPEEEVVEGQAAAPDLRGSFATNEEEEVVEGQAAAPDLRESFPNQRVITNEVFVDNCFCPVGSVSRAPTQAEFVTAINFSIQVLLQEGEIHFVNNVLGFA